MTYVRDRWISAQLETALLLDMAVLHINYDIETVNGVVYLMGIVQEEGELARVAGRHTGCEARGGPRDRTKITRAICLYLTAARARDEHALGVARRSVVATTICRWPRETAIPLMHMAPVRSTCCR